MSAPFDLLYSETEEELRAAVRALLADRCDSGRVLARAESDRPHDPDLWRTLAMEIGTAGLLVPEKLGGQGAGHREAAVVLEELGRAVAPVPYLTSAVLATEILLACDPAEVAGLLRELATGRQVCVPAVPLTLAPGAPLPTAVRDSGGGILSGTVTSVADAVAADVLLVLADTGLYAVPAAAASLTPLVPLDLTRPLATVTLDGAAGTRLADPATARAVIAGALLSGAGLLASEQLGIAEWCLTETVGYVRGRHQFNRPVGSFQALKHRLARLWLDVASARAAARAAADALATGAPEAPLTVAVAQAYCSGVAVRAAEECVQLHGGIGMTWEHPAHLYLKRAKADSLTLGTAGHHRTLVADFAELPFP
ncbi:MULTISPECIES: acyl-CoA dehydrogenase family protein [unclassified Streptomyces]|uniref:acyl-CoA dehydrogenase family protein n=1 Tax=unclassified Streptomyces TaxID=2593676 RepID=UPI001BE9B928|nr:MULTISPECIES: acyl-CoA dehydrogenase family protein [unclassified Streptomyces]MBT2405166.1 acyl-CoA/acyl-ACP dehydrogenase [Streptomyces sp. ISL-21]MBT2454780.1 acyl-CoA/acyl-ACP dehydrogenase [Streptomyces sp. ISL-86]MBT2610934.1 acyl-CoA/acyl-ACP dehydrogenase [Streptomyces sp. ISL-87]